jgi:hypothetical protein
MSSLRRYVFAMLGLAFLAVGTCRADDMKVLARFGDWSLIAWESKKFLMVVDPLDRLAVTCSGGERIYVIFLKIIDQKSVSWDESRKASYFRFTAWVDGHDPKDFEFLVPPEEPKGPREGQAPPSQPAQVIVSLNPTITGPHQDFWHLLNSAHTRFSYSTPAATFSFDATDLQAALQRFEDVCSKIMPAPYQAPAENPSQNLWFGR